MRLNRESYPCVAFDCDSTLSTIEGIDELAVRAGREAEIAPLTAAAMDGSLAIEDVYARRLDVLRPSASDLVWLGQRYIDTIVPGAIEAVLRLKQDMRAVCIVSGGLRGPVLALAQVLGIEARNVHAVDVFTDEAGRYRDFDRHSPLTRSDGKARVAAELQRRHGAVVLIGDGVTDVAAKASGAYVIGFGGVVRRTAVADGADHFIDSASLAAVADYLTG